MGVAELFFPLALVVPLAALMVVFQARIAAPVAARLAVGATVSVSVVGFVGAVLIAFQFWAHVPWTTNIVRWCAMLGDAHAPVSAGFGIVASLVVFTSLVRTARYWHKRRTASAQHASLRRALDNDVAVADDPAVFAYSLPGREPVTIVSTGLLAALAPCEQQIVLAHEQAHHRFRHDRYLHVARVAATVFPPALVLLSGLEHALERWADEHAASVVGDRRLVAVTVARTALIASRPNTSLGALGFTATGPFTTTRRVESLLRPPAKVPVWTLAPTVGVVAALVTQLHHFEGLIRSLCRL